MEKLITESVSNSVFCILQKSLTLSGIKESGKYLNFKYSDSSDKRLFGTLIIETVSIDDLKLGMFLQAFKLLSERENIKINVQIYRDRCGILIFKPAKIQPLQSKKVLKIKIEGEEKKIFCKVKPKKVYKHRVKVRFRDLDAMGHVSNNVFMVYLEEARVGIIDYLSRHGKKKVAFSSVVASHNIEYVAPIFLGEELEVEVFISNITEKSYRFNYRILNKKSKEIKAIAYTQMIGYDYEKQTVKPLPKDFITPIKDFVL